MTRAWIGYLATLSIATVICASGCEKEVALSYATDGPVALGDAGVVGDGSTGGDAASGPHNLGESCDDGRGCPSGAVCKAVGDPCATFPNCKVCYTPCDSSAPNTCAVGQTCVAPFGQGGDVCIGQPCSLTSASAVSCTSGLDCAQYNGYCSTWDSGQCACNGPQCTVGQDFTCNENPIIATALGHCRTDGLCDCVHGTKDPVSGKCK